MPLCLLLVISSGEKQETGGDTSTDRESDVDVNMKERKWKAEKDARRCTPLEPKSPHASSALRLILSICTTGTSFSGLSITNMYERGGLVHCLYFDLKADLVDGHDYRY